MTQRMIQRWPAMMAVFLCSLELLACPLCHTGTGKEVRAGIFDGGDFLFNLFVVIAPFPILGLIVAWIYQGSFPLFRGLLRRQKPSPAYNENTHEFERNEKYGNAS